MLKYMQFLKENSQEGTIGADYIDSQFKQNNDKSQQIKLNKGDRISVNGNQGEIVKLPSNNDNLYLIEFDEDISKNKSKYTKLVDGKLITFVKSASAGSNISKPATDFFEMNDEVLISNSASRYYNKKGKIAKVWKDDNTYMVDMEDVGHATISMFFYRRDLELVKKNNFNILNPNPPKSVTLAYSEEEEDDLNIKDLLTDITTNTKAPVKKADLLEISYKDFFIEDKTTDINDILTIKNSYEKSLSNPNLPNIKKAFIERTISTIDIVETYFTFLTHKVAEGRPVIRTVEQIDNLDLIKNKTKVRASDSKELTRKYSFDQGIIVYWKFKDAVVFKTI